MSRPSPATVLVAVNAVLLVLLAAMWFTPQGQLRGARWEPPVAVRPDFSGTVSPDRGGGDMDRFMAVLDRPLFSPNRLPAPAKGTPGAAAAPVVDALANVQVFGIFSGAEGAGILARIDGKARTVRVNESIGDWTIKDIKDRDITLARGDETRVLQLTRPKPAPAAPSAGGPGGAPAGGAAANPLPQRYSAESLQQIERERTARINAIRAKAGLPPISP